MKPITSFHVAGFNHCKKGLIGMFYHGRPIECDLVPEIDNKYDQYAVRIDCKGQKIGYVPRGYIGNGVGRSVPGNYNHFLSQCLQAGMEFKSIAVARFQWQSTIDGRTIRCKNIHEVEPLIVIFPEKYDYKSADIDPDPNIEIDINSVVEYTTFKYITGNLLYKDNGKIFEDGMLYYNEYTDSYCVWCGREVFSLNQNIRLDIEILEEDDVQKEATESVFTFIGKADINPESIIYKNDLLRNLILKTDDNYIAMKQDQERVDLFKNFIERHKV